MRYHINNRKRNATIISSIRVALSSTITTVIIVNTYICNIVFFVPTNVPYSVLLFSNESF